MDWWEIQQIVLPVLGMGMATYFGTLIFKTIHKVIDRKAAAQLTAEEVTELRGAIEDMQAELRDGLADIQERLDFTERALTSGRPRTRNRPDTPVSPA
jgi:hypothetical protein